MALTGDRTYVGFGFGAIQSGLFLYEAYRSGKFQRLVVAEVIPEVVSEKYGIPEGQPPLILRMKIISRKPE